MFPGFIQASGVLLSIQGFRRFAFYSGFRRFAFYSKLLAFCFLLKASGGLLSIQGFRGLGMALTEKERGDDT